MQLKFTTVSIKYVQRQEMCLSLGILKSRKWDGYTNMASGRVRPGGVRSNWLSGPVAMFEEVMESDP